MGINVPFAEYQNMVNELNELRTMRQRYIEALERNQTFETDIRYLSENLAELQEWRKKTTTTTTTEPATKPQ